MTYRVAAAEELARVRAELCSFVPPRDARGIEDKFARFAGLPGRAVLLALEDERVVGLKCVKTEGEPPADAPAPVLARLATHGTGNLLYVLPERRGTRIAEELFRAGEDWTASQGCDGFWLVTRRLRPWYERRLGYHLAAAVVEDGAEKCLMARAY